MTRFWISLFLIKGMYLWSLFVVNSFTFIIASIVRTVIDFVFVSGKLSSDVLNAVNTWFPYHFRVVIKDVVMPRLSLFLVLVARNWKVLCKVNAWRQFANSSLSPHSVACIYKLMNSISLICLRCQCRTTDELESQSNINDIGKPHILY